MATLRMVRSVTISRNAKIGIRSYSMEFRRRETVCRTRFPAIARHRVLEPEVADRETGNAVDRELEVGSR
jgi:hypothetical protein